MLVAWFDVAEPGEQLITDLWEARTLGVAEVAGGVQAYFDDQADLAALQKKYQVRIEHADAWQVTSGAELAAEPVAIGKCFVAGNANTADAAGKHVLRLKSHGSFGSGRHESTQLILEALETLPLKGITVLDVGCGTAITSEAARCLGAERVIGCDPDDAAMETARANFPHIKLMQGSVDAIRSRSTDVVIANISARVIDGLADELCRVCRDEKSRILLGGFIEQRVPVRFRPLQVTQRDDWQCWVCRRDDIQAVIGSSSEVQPFDRLWWQ